MRTRRYNKIMNESDSAYRDIYAPTVESGPLGQQVVLPLVLQGRVANGSFSALGADSSEISDDLLYKAGIAPCDHIKRYTSVVKPILRADLNYYWAPRLGYGSSLATVRPSQYWFDNQIGTAALSLANAIAPMNVATMTDNDACPGNRTDDRSSELAPKIMNRMERLHLLNTAYEARELPALLKQYSRGRLIRDILPKLRSLRLGLPGSKWQSMKQLAREYRKGHLAWAFGIMPTVQDFTNITKQLRDYKPFKRTFVVTIRDNVQHSPQFWSFPSNNRFKMTIRREQIRVFGCRVTSAGNDLKTPFFQKWQAIEDRFFGVNPLQSIWEAVPASFAIDSLLSLDDMLDQFYLNSQNRFDLSYWKSSKIVAERQVTYETLVDFSVSSPFPYGLTPTIDREEYIVSALNDRYTHYSRVPLGNPNPLSAIHARPALKGLYLLGLIALGIRR